MDDAGFTILVLIAMVVILVMIALPIVALVISIRSRLKLKEHLHRASLTPADSNLLQEIRKADLAPMARALQELEARIQNLERSLAGGTRPVEPITPPPPTVIGTTPAPPLPIAAAPPPPTTIPQALTASLPRIKAAEIESIIGRRWLGWVAISLILFATAFFLKYAFDNRWIGELGRVTIGVAAGVTLAALGFKYHRRAWRIFSQILTAGGVVLLYLSAYAAFGYYHLVPQKAAFVFLIVLVAEAAGLALLYDAPAIAIMALIGGFLSPLLLRSDRDQYRSLFGYITVLDLGALALLKHWRGLTSLAFAGTHLLFWLWYADHYHPQKLTAVMVFQTTIFGIFLIAYLGRRLLRREAATFEDFGLLPLNAFVFFATAYHLLNPKHHDWMGVLAILMALVYAIAARVTRDRATASRREVLTMIAVALTFVTVAIPIQLRANWITIAWSVEALTMMWAGIRLSSVRLQGIGGGLFVLALGKLLLWDTTLLERVRFTPVLNKYFLSSMVVVGCLFAAAALYQNHRDRLSAGRHLAVVFLLTALAILWFLMSFETHSYFSTRAAALQSYDDIRHERWLGQMVLSVLWSVYAAVLIAVGFIRRSAILRWSALGLFGLTVIKVMLVDVAQLKQLYRIIAFLVLGLLLLAVAWGYHKVFRSRESST
jgi:uncharacterized membrane protein